MEPIGTIDLVPQIKVEVLRGFINLGTLEFIDFARDLDQITIYLSVIKMTEVYTIQIVLVFKIKVWEHTLAKQAKDANKRIKKMKLVRQENDEKMKAWEENC